MKRTREINPGEHAFLLIEEVAVLLRTTPNSVRYWIQTGKLKSIRPGRRRLIPRVALDEFLEKSAQRGL